MRLRLVLVLIYAAAVCASFAARSSAHPDSISITRPDDKELALGLDLDGRRGLVLFYHKVHERLDRRAHFTPPYLNKAAGEMNCAVCHHRRSADDPSKPDAIDLTDLNQFQKCSNCHREEGDRRNFYDQEGFELSSREAYHRLCAGCHISHNRAGSALAQASFKRAPVRCGDCHDREGRYEARAAPVLPAPDEYVAIAEREPDLSGAAIFRTPKDEPVGFAGPSGIESPPQATAGARARADRWRIGFPEDPRFERGDIWNPYRQNVLKGDYPVFGQTNFAVVTAESESFFNARRIPVPSNVSAQRPDSSEFFGRGGQFFFRQNFVLSFELFNGDTSFKPVDWRIRVTPNFNVNYLYTQENGIVNIDFRRGNTRTDGHVTLQEIFGEVRLGDTTRLLPFLPGGRENDRKSPYFDTTSLRVGIQPFISDFRGLIFSDVNLGTRLFGNYANNRYQFNAAYFYLLEKDTNSELNAFEFRNQTVFIANLFRQDTRWKGYTTQFSFHYNNDRPSRHFDTNDFLVRPSLIGDVAPHGIKASYLGWAGDGHIGRWNINHAFYQALGHDTRNPIAGRRTSINAQMAAAEVSLDRDWLRFKGSIFWASGDDEPFDDAARGFDSILELQEFAGGPFSFWNSQGIPLTNTAVLLTAPGSLLPSFRSNKLEGQANFVNPGIFIYNTGLEAELTPKLRGIVNLNYLHFHHTEPLEELLFQPAIRRPVGFDYGVGFFYRPLLSENWIVAAGFSSLVPGVGFKDIYSSNCAGQGCGANSKILYSAFVKLKFIY
ncbi:MAG TPA: cytochrome c3 family protein [Blastocatellia bacterium]